MTQRLYPVLLCGGSGTRLWPLSRSAFPKQFVRLLGEESQFQMAAKSTKGSLVAPPMIITGTEFRFVVVEQIKAAGVAHGEILIEPAPRNTAAAVCACAVALQARDPQALMLVLPSDHVIPDVARFNAAVATAIAPALAGRLVTFGIAPDRPETGYGWLELHSPLADGLPAEIQPLKSFVEKPDLETATRLLAGKTHLWNAGIFLFSASAILAAFEKFAPEILSAARAAVGDARQDLVFTRLAPDHWDAIHDISIDHAIMEKADNLSVVPYLGKWSDLGDWHAIWREAKPDNAGVVTTKNALAVGCTNTLLYAADQSQQIVGIDLCDIIAVAMPDAVLIAHKDSAQKVKQAVATLKRDGVPQAQSMPRHYRPWGWYDQLTMGTRFQVKRIVVKPGGILSLQLHHHRSEHWVVVEGTARVTIGDEVKIITENQSIYVPLGTMHRLENPGKVNLTLIEVQTGAYLGEDDIERHDDAYARHFD